MPPTCDGLVAVTVTPGRTAPVPSLTVPVSVDVCTACARSGIVDAATPLTRAIRAATDFHVMPESPFCARVYTFERCSLMGKHDFFRGFFIAGPVVLLLTA